MLQGFLSDALHFWNSGGNDRVATASFHCSCWLFWRSQRASIIVVVSGKEGGKREALPAELTILV